LLTRKTLVCKVDGRFAISRRLTYDFRRKAYLMLKYFNARLGRINSPLLVAVLAVVVSTSGCGIFNTHKTVRVPPLLSPLREAGKDRLIAEVNKLASTTSVHGKVDVQFEDTSFATVGIADKYRQVDGTVTLQRPAKIHMAIQLLFVDLVQMSSDGEHFRVAVLQGEEKYKRFVKGTNNAVYDKLNSNGVKPDPKMDSKQKSEKQTVSALSNLRPQHLTDALLMRPIERQPGMFYAESQFFQEEKDARREAGKDDRVIRAYYLLDELEQTQSGDLLLRRRFWFDRVGEIRLARLQTYDDRGALITDVAYFNEKPFGAGPTVNLPSRIEITRPQDQYKLSISYQDPVSVELNRDYPPQSFVLENKWQLPEVDLDAQNSRKVTANH
jgi:hypothetical protein